MLWKISVIRIGQDVKRPSELNGPAERAVNVEGFTSLFPSRDRPALLLSHASHAADWVYNLGVPDQFKNVAIAWAVAIGVGPCQIEMPIFGMGEDQLTLAMPIWEW